jgi:hypothetical protein
MAFWWVLMAAGVGLLVATARGHLRAHGPRRVPRPGLSSSFTGVQQPWWMWAVYVTGIVATILAAHRLGGTEAGQMAYFGGAVVVSQFGQAGLSWAHNRRAAAGTGTPGA